MDKKSAGSIISQMFLIIFIIFACIICLYPFIYVISVSISSPEHVVSQDVWLFPKGFSLDGYKLVFETKAFWVSYLNTIIYTVVGTFINVTLTTTVSYALSRKNFSLRKPIMMMIVFTMLFSGGLIPMFILVNNLGLYDTRWAMLLPNAVAAWNVIIATTFFRTLPVELEESANIDGANDLTIFFRIMLPLSMPIVAVLTLFYAVGHWNSYFNAMLYLPSTELQPLQLYLMKILVQLSDDIGSNVQTGISRTALVEQFRYATIVITILPIICVYPFLQRHFVKGVMIGSLKD